MARWLTVQQFSVFYRIPVDTVKRMIRERLIPSIEVPSEKRVQYRVLDYTPDYIEVMREKQDRLWDAPLLTVTDVAALLRVTHGAIIHARRTNPKGRKKNPRLRGTRVGKYLRYSLREVEAEVAYRERKRGNKQWKFYRPNTIVDWAGEELEARDKAAPTLKAALGRDSALVVGEDVLP